MCLQKHGQSGVHDDSLIRRLTYSTVTVQLMIYCIVHVHYRINLNLNPILFVPQGAVATILQSTVYEYSKLATNFSKRYLYSGVIFLVQ